MKKTMDVLCTLLFFLLCIWFCINAAVLAPLVREALRLCATVLVPSLFPFLFLTQFLVRTGLAEKAGTVVSFILSPLFGIPKALCGAFLSGLAGGFPNGAAAAGIAYENGRCSKTEAERTVALANNASPAFLISVAGAFSLGSVKAGFLLCAALFLTVLTNALLLRICYPQKANENVVFTPPVHASFTSSLCSSANHAVSNMLSVCGYVILFYMLSGTIGRSLLNDANILAKFGVQALFEVSGAVTMTQSAEFPLNHVLCAAAIGFSGLSVICQVTDLCEKYGLSSRQFLFTRLTGAVLLPVFTALLLLVLPRETIAVFGYAVPTVTNLQELYGIILLYAFFCVIATGVLLLFLLGSAFSEKIREIHKKEV